jgi:hypothetical protein
MKYDADYLRRRGWATWYNENYWVHPKTVQDPKVQDFTNYGLDLEAAIAFEREKRRPFPSIGSAERCISALYQKDYSGV